MTTRLLLWAIGLVLLTAVIRLPSLLHPQLIGDERPYAVVAHEIVDGGRLYITAIDRKPPLLFWTYAAVFKAAGKFNWLALHLTALLWILLTMAGLALTARRLFDWETGLVAALLYAVFHDWATSKNVDFNGEVLMNLPLVWAWAIALAPSRRRFRPELLGAGALLCAGFLLKQPAAIAAVPLGVYLLLPSYRASRGLTVRESVVQASLLTAGFFFALGSMALILKRQGILPEAYYWTIADHDVPHIFWLRAVEHTLAFVAACLPLLLGAGMSLRPGDLWAGKRSEWLALWGLLAVSVVGAAASGRFYPHYYIQLIPPLALLAAPGLTAVWRKRPQDVPRSGLVGLTTARGWLAITVVAFAIIHWWELQPQRESTEAGRYIREHASPEDRIFVWGQTAGIYLDARRRPASRYVMTFPLTGYIFGAPLPEVDTRDRIVPGSWANLESDLAAHPPAYIVDAEAAPTARYPAARFPALASLLAEHYSEVTRTREGIIYRRTSRGS